MMRRLRIDQDPEQGKSRQRLAEMDLLKKNCERTRKALPDYLRGHVFWITKKRIERHLDRCAVCRSEFEALKRINETSQLLKYVDTPEGLAHRVKEGISSLAKLKTILYRPLWFAGIVLSVAGIYYYAHQPRQLDIEIDDIVKTAPITTAAVTPPEAIKPNTLAVTPPAARRQKPEPVPAQTVEPLVVSITPVSEAPAIRHLNEIMEGHEQLRKLKFSDTHRELSGKLTAPELLIFFERIREVAKVRYDRKRLASFPADQQVSFVLKLKKAPGTVEKPVPAEKPEQITKTEKHAPAEVAAPAPATAVPMNTSSASSAAHLPKAPAVTSPAGVQSPAPESTATPPPAPASP
jgi:hypothetical protein